MPYLVAGRKPASQPFFTSQPSTLWVSNERDRFFSTRAKLQTKSVGELFEVQLGKMLSQKARTGNGSCRYLGNKSVQWGRFDLSELLEMDFSLAEREKFALRAGDLLVCEGGEVGRSAIWKCEIEDCYYQKALHRLRPMTDEITPEYMLQFMYWGNTKGLFAAMTGHSTIAHLPAVKLKSVSVPLPTTTDQNDFLVKLALLQDSVIAAGQHAQKTRELMKAILDIAT